MSVNSGSSEGYNASEVPTSPDGGLSRAAESSVVYSAAPSSSTSQPGFLDAVGSDLAAAKAAAARLGMPLRAADEGTDSARLADEGISVARPGIDAADEGTGGYDRVTAAREDRAVILEAVRVITGTLTVLSQALSREQSLEQLQVAEQVVAGATQLLRVADEMLGTGADQGPDLAVAAIARATAVKSEVKSARRRWRSPAWDTVWSEAKVILSRLWSVIWHLVKVKEWSVQGKVGNDLLGLASANVSITFG